MVLAFNNVDKTSNTTNECSRRFDPWYWVLNSPTQGCKPKNASGGVMKHAILDCGKLE
jgi:hypothetical protein